jgi:hypothetical protein
MVKHYLYLALGYKGQPHGNMELINKLFIYILKIKFGPLHVSLMIMLIMPSHGKTQLQMTFVINTMNMTNGIYNTTIWTT